MGFGWSGLSMVTSLVVRTASSLVLTRLLAPEYFGLFGAALAVLNILELFSDLGVQPALIRHPQGDRTEYLLTGWSLNLARAAVLSAVLAVAAFPLAWWGYRQPVLGPILLLLAVWPLVVGLRSPAWPTVRRRIHFRAVFYDEAAQVATQTVVSIALAWATGSIWSIAIGSLCGVMAGALVTYRICPMRPRLVWDREALSAIAHMSVQILFNTMATGLWMHLDRLTGLRLVGPRPMGFYVIAINLVAALTLVIRRGCDVYFTVLSRHTDLESRTALHRKVSLRAALWGTGVLALGALVAPMVIGLLYDARYAGVRVPFAILLVRMMFYGLGMLQYQYLLSLAEVRLNTRALLAALVVEVVLLVPLARAWGAPGMAICLLISSIVYAGVQCVVLQLKGLRALTPLLLATAWAALALLPLPWTGPAPKPAKAAVSRVSSSSR
jgi:O-antigen/teichoic acid export membrane protein